MQLSCTGTHTRLNASLMRRRATADPRNAFHRLWTLGGDAPWKEDRARKHYAGNEAITADPTKPTVLGEPQRKGWLRKTYQERRTWFALFRAFFRVLAFHILLFHACLALALSDLFDGRWWVPVSTVVSALPHSIPMP